MKTIGKSEAVNRMAEERDRVSFQRLWFGSGYYPEWFPREQWLEDARLMRKTGMNCVRLGDFCWSRLEPGALSEAERSVCEGFQALIYGCCDKDKATAKRQAGYTGSTGCKKRQEIGRLDEYTEGETYLGTVAKQRYLTPFYYPKKLLRLKFMILFPDETGIV